MKVDSLKAVQQWQLCRENGLSIIVSKPSGSATYLGWIKADEVEKLLLILLKAKEVVEFK